MVDTRIENKNSHWSLHSYTLTYVEKDWQNWEYTVNGVLKVRFRSISRKDPFNLEGMKRRRREEVALELKRLQTKARIYGIKLEL